VQHFESTSTIRSASLEATPARNNSPPFSVELHCSGHSQKQKRSQHMPLAIILAFLMINPALQQRYTGILNQKAPSLGVRQWHQLPEGKKTIDIDDFKGKVVYLFCFQAWCPGCHSHGFPTLKKVMQHFGNDPGVVFVAVQTTFEGYSANGFRQAKDVAKKYELDIPVGQSGTRKSPSKLMRSYNTGGTPWTVIIDKDGVVRYNHYQIPPEDAIQIIKQLKQRPMQES